MWTMSTLDHKFVMQFSRQSVQLQRFIRFFGRCTFAIIPLAHSWFVFIAQQLAILEMFHPICLLWCLILGTILVLCQHREDVTVAEGEAFVLTIPRKLEHSHHNLPQCSLETKGTTFHQSTIKSSGEVLEKLESREYCQFKVKNVSAVTSRGEWRLKAQWTSDRGKRETDTQTKAVNVNVNPRTIPKCPPNPSSDDCELKNLETNETRNCKTVPNDWKSFECSYFEQGVMEVRKVNGFQYLTFESAPQALMQSGPNFVEGNTAILECKSGRIITSCTIEHFGASHRRFNIEEGLAYRDYTAFKTLFQDGVCQFQMPSPIRDVDAGSWTIHIQGQNDMENRKCDFMLKSPYSSIEKSSTDSIIIINTTEEEAVIPCARGLTYPLTKCYMPMPDMSIIEFKEPLDGICEFTVKPGIWICGFNRESPNEPDILRHFEVRQFNNEAIEGKANMNDQTLSCRHIYKKALSACIFLSPSGQIYSLPSERFYAHHRFHYHPADNKLSDGYCGIKFLSKMLIEDGTWKCIIQVKNNDQDFSLDIHVK